MDWEGTYGVVVGDAVTTENVTVGRSVAMTLNSVFVKTALVAASTTNTMMATPVWTIARFMPSLPPG
jgi:hypothetical protein